MSSKNMNPRLLTIFVIAITLDIVLGDCYWNAKCPYQLFSTRTPYDAVRGDFRDYQDPPNCQVLSIWTLNRHGNRNPGDGVTEEVKVISQLKDEIIKSYEEGRGQLCAQDIDLFRQWTWNTTLEVSPAYLTGTGYEELYGIGSRIRQKYPQLLNASDSDFYFRPTAEQRTITSAIAFVHGLVEGTNLNLTVDDTRTEDTVIRPYEICERYQKEVKSAVLLEDNLNDYALSEEYIAVQTSVQSRLGITTKLSSDDIYSIYELCGFDRSWTSTHQSPWCAAFSNEDLEVLEYRDDLRHYYRNGYGSWVNARLGGPAVRDLYESFLAATQGEGKRVVGYFSHDTLMEMFYGALGMFRDRSRLQGSQRPDNRLWNTNYISPFAVNVMALLYSCQDGSSQTHRVQFLHNERPTSLCPETGCTWDQFLEIVQPYTNATLDFCDLNYPPPKTDNGIDLKAVTWLVSFSLVSVFLH